MNDLVRRFAAASLFAAGLAAVVPGTATAQIMATHENELTALTLVHDSLHLSPALEPLDNVRAFVNSDFQSAWSSFQLNHGAWNAHVDGRSGRIESAEGAGIAWIPGKGNQLKRADLGDILGSKASPDLASLETIAKRFVDANSKMFGVSSKELTLNPGRSGKPADYLWFVDFDVTRAGMVVEGARVVFRVNHGNLIQFGMENVPPAGVAIPKVNISAKQALETVSRYVGGLGSNDEMIDAGSLHLLPTQERDARFAEGFAFGKGYGLAAVYEVKFRREGVLGTWRARVDATSGAMLELYDVNDYAQASGGVILNVPSSADTVRAMPFTNLSGGGFTNSGGLYNFTAANSSTLNGQYVQIADGCGAISQTSNASGDILFGSSASGTDCTTPGVGGTGNTRSARTQFYWLNRIKEVGRGWLPTNTWLNAKLIADTNLPATCNAYWNGTRVRFFKASAPCGNTGQIPGVSIHEYGHGLDSNDGNGSSPDNGTGETIGDFTAALALHQSCVGPGFLGSNCGGYGNACTSCTGVRDIDWAKHARNTPSTVANFTQTTCPQPSANNPNYVGPCGRDAINRGVTANKREGHCESYISSESLWDFVNRDLPSPGSGAAWTVMDRLWYLSRSTGTQGFTCDTSTATWTSNGCNTGSLWKVMRAVDDDNGNLNDGTPHGGALFAAFNRHGIACTTDTGASTTFAGCTPPTTPTLTLTGGNNSATVSWTNSGAGVVYDVYRNEAGCNAGFVKVANDTASTSFADTAVANGTTYFYQVVAQPSGNEACGGAPATCQSVTPAAAPCTPPAAPTGVTATAAGQTQVNLTWTASAGATEYRIYRSTTSGGPYTQVGTSATTSFSNTGLTCNTGYFYVVRAANSATCESGNSAQASATTAACTGCTTQTLFTNGFETGTGLTGFATGTFVAGGSTASWRGIQTCTAQTGTKVFRYGGTTCTANYTNSNFTYAQPNGTGGITVPAGATTARLSFGHRRRFESGFDGGTLAVSVDGANYTFVPAAAILAGGYNGTVSASCPPAGAAGASIWTGVSTAFTTTTVDLDAACNAATGLTTGCAGQAVRIAFTSITDCSTTDDGWFLDNVAVTACVP